MPEQEKDRVTIEHPDYTATSDMRTDYEAVCEGTRAVRKGAEKYLYKMPKEEPDDFAFRLKKATVQHFTAKTIDSLCGLVFQKDISFGDDMPDEIKGKEATDEGKEIPGLVENIDNQGTHFNVFARDLFEDSFDGWAGILVDAPTAKVVDLGQQRSLGLRPYWIAYDACDITNWAYEINPISKRKELALVVLRERLSEKAGQFLRKNKTQYRVLMLDDARNPIWQVWVESDTKDAEGKVEYKLDNDGTFEKQTRIPFAVVGELGDKPPLIDLVDKELEFYNAYSDYLNHLHVTNYPLRYATGITVGDLPNAIGPHTIFLLPENCTLGYAEPSGKSFADTRVCLQDMLSAMATIGLQMLMANRRANADVTATEKLLDSIQETSSLQVQATQLKDALELALGFTAAYLGKGEDVGGSISLGATWNQLTLTADELNAWSGLVDLGQMSLETFVQLRQEAGQLPDDVDAQTELDRIKTEMKDAASTVPVINAQKMPNEVKNGTEPNPAQQTAAEPVKKAA